ncbi:hypothetical protein GTA51_01330 [Desulfovibrio aerotolerans]|uniref:Lipoprotein n=1 Tax=Solidesulfovibrio aerotolerans TaxID=295255 RepID=A0A7C9IJ30_9BACT|nr:hypothetical protein [Solidesulfovibrio aerotolerans]MYL81781.1 hypothetical protein [Solidesulfovibrio aerotolerans]
MYKRIVVTVVTLILVASACFVGIHEYLRRTEIQQKEELMRIELAKQQAEIQIQEAARKKIEEEERVKQEAAAKEEEARKAAQQAEIAAKIAGEYEKSAKLVGGIERSVRKSYLKNFVLQLNNPSSATVSFDLKCYHLDGTPKTLRVSIDAYQTKEISFQEGWTDNFLPGEKVEALLDGNVIWAYTIP